MKQKSIQYDLIAGIMLLLAILCFGYGAFAQEIKPLARITQGGFHPIACPQGFIQNRDLWVDTVSSQTWIATGALTWRLSPTQLGKGIKGDKGDTGASGLNGTNGVNGTNGTNGVDGVCPTCPPSSGGGANVGNVRWVTTWTELSSALTDNSIRAIYLANNITQTSKVRLPQNLNTIKVIEGNGFDWTIPATIDTAIVRTYASLSEANMGIDMQLRITDVSFKGSSRATICMAIHASYGSRIEGCRFYNFKTAFYGGWTMATVIDQCFFWENNTSIDFDYARFSGGSNSASQSNHSSVSNCKFRHSAGQFAAIKATAVSGLTVNHNIFEGIQSGSQYHVYFDDNGSPVVKEFHAYGNHVEQQPSIASFYVRLKDGNAYVGGVYSQYDCTLIKFESAGYAKIIVENIPYLTSGTKFENVNGAGRWKFINLPATFLITDASKWVGTMPINSAIDSYQTNGQSNYLQGTTIKTP